MAKSAKTLRKEKFKSKAIVRSKSVKNGAAKILSLLARAEVNEVSNVVDSYQALDLLMLTKVN